MTPTDFTPLSSLAGGAMIGLASALLMAIEGRIAGVSDIAARLFPPRLDRATPGRLAFVAGLILAPAAYFLMTGAVPRSSIEAGPALLAVGGLLVGFGAAFAAALFDAAALGATFSASLVGAFAAAGFAAAFFGAAFAAAVFGAALAADFFFSASSAISQSPRL